MNDPRTEIQNLLDQADATPYGPAEQALLLQAMELLPEVDEDRLGLEVRTRLISSYSFGSEDIDAKLTAFAWCLARYDANPEQVNEWGFTRQLFWGYKWMPTAMVCTPIFATEQIEAILDDMDQRYQRAGIGMSGPLNSRLYVLGQQGRYQEAEQVRLELLAAPRDHYSDCRACVASTNARVLIDSGRIDEGRAVIDDMLAARMSCMDEPAGVLAMSLLPSLQAGEFETARARHLKGYRESKKRPTHAAMVADHLVFTAVTGHHERGLDMVERHLTWLMSDPLDADTQLRLLQGVGLVLAGVTEAGHGEVTVRTSDDPTLAPLLGSHDGRWTAADLAERAWQVADDLAAQFDARNGNDVVGRRNGETKGLAAVRYPVTLD